MAKIDYVNVDKIKELSKEKGISLKYFCDHFGKYRTYLANVRSGVNKLDEDELVFIADTLNTTVEYLTDQSDQKEKPTPDEVSVDDLIDMVLKLDDKKLAEFVQKFNAVLKNR